MLSRTGTQCLALLCNACSLAALVLPIRLFRFHESSRPGHSRSVGHRKQGWFYGKTGKMKKNRCNSACTLMTSACGSNPWAAHGREPGLLHTALSAAHTWGAATPAVCKRLPRAVAHPPCAGTGLQCREMQATDCCCPRRGKPTSLHLPMPEGCQWLGCRSPAAGSQPNHTLSVPRLLHRHPCTTGSGP